MSIKLNFRNFPKDAHSQVQCWLFSHRLRCFHCFLRLQWLHNECRSQITGVSLVYSTICSDADQRKHQSSASLAFVRGIHRWPVVSLTKGQWRGKRFHLMTSSWAEYLFLLQQHDLSQWISMIDVIKVCKNVSSNIPGEQSKMHFTYLMTVNNATIKCGWNY